MPFEVYEDGVYLPGTKADLAVGEMLVPSRESNFEDGRVMNYVCLTATLDAATGGARLAGGEGCGRIYIVEPTGEFEDDPNVMNKRFAEESDAILPHPRAASIVGELVDWVRHSAEKIQAVREDSRKQAARSSADRALSDEG